KSAPSPPRSSATPTASAPSICRPAPTRPAPPLVGNAPTRPVPAPTRAPLGGCFGGGKRHCAADGGRSCDNNKYLAHLSLLAMSFASNVLLTSVVLLVPYEGQLAGRCGQQ